MGQQDSSPTLEMATTAPEVRLAESPSDQAIVILKDEGLAWPEKVARLQEMSNVHAGVAEVWAAYGEALEKTGERPRALLAFEKATQINPALYSPWMWVGILSKRGAPSPDLPRAEMAFRRALAEGAPRPQALNELGVTLALEGRTKDAIDAWKQGVEADPEWGALYNNLMKGAVRMGDESTAREYLPGAIAAKRFEEGAVLQFGEYLISRGKAKEAVDVYMQAVSAHPANARLRYYYGVALGEAGRGKEAESALIEAQRVARESDEITDVAQAADWAIFRIRFPKDEKQFQEARKLVFQPETDFTRIAKDLKKAVKMLDPLVDKHPEFWNGYFIRGVAHRRLNEVEPAQADLEKVLSLFPNEPNATMELALMKRDLYDFQAAADLAEKAIKLAPRDPMFAINGGLIMLEAGRCERARELYRAATLMVGEENTVILKDQIDIRCR